MTNSYKQPINVKRVTGFTLIEVVVAVAILSVVSFSVYNASVQRADVFTKVEQKTLGNWIAENRLTQIRLEGEWPQRPRLSEDIEFAGKDWVVTTLTERTPDNDMRKVTVQVSLAADEFFDEARLVHTLESFVARHRQP